MQGNVDTLVIILAIATILSTIADVIQVAIAWFTLREVGDLDKDRTDWFEQKPFREYEDEKME